MVEIVGLVFVAVPELREVCRYVSRSVGVGVVFGVGDVIGFFYAAVFAESHVVDAHPGVHVVVVGEVVAEDGAVEERCGLVVVVAASVEVIDVEADA